MVMTIDSPTNPFVKKASALHQKKHRDELGLVLVEGIHPVEEAIKAELMIYQCFVLDEKNLNPNLPSATLQVVASERVMSKLSSTDSPSPCVATVEKPEPQDIDSLDAKTALVLILDRIQDPGNMGTLIRSAKAFGVDAIILTEGSVDPYNSKVIRSSAGMVFSLPILTHSGPVSEALNQLNANGFKLILTRGQSEESLDYKAVDYTGGCVLVFGNEGAGLPELPPLSNAQWVSIPMDAEVDSLNVGVSGSILLAEAAAQRKDDGSGNRG